MTRREALICLLLAGITLGIYWPARHFDIIYLDDPQVLTDCKELKAGLTIIGIKWALTGVVAANWHPVTNFSFLLVSQLFGTAPGPHHLVNAIIHAANASLLFLFLVRLTGVTWRSAAAAAIFAWHPLRVESVAWISERKDVLCGFFFLLSLLAYARFARKRADDPRRPWKTMDFNLCLLAFLLALLSKPMAVTLPFVLLLLDFWPLQRMTLNSSQSAGLKPTESTPAIRQPLSLLCLEKWPFFVLTILFCLVTYRVQHDSAAMIPWGEISPAGRLANSVAGYVGYSAKWFWPANLAVLYPLYPGYDLTQTLLKTAFLLFVSLGCICQLTIRPWLAMGWFWFLGMSVPVIGLVQVGSQSMADRYTYLPMIGPIVALVWTAVELFSKWRRGKIILITSAILLLPLLITLSERQLQLWRNTVPLFEHTVAVTRLNPPAMFALGVGYEHNGQTNLAITSYLATRAIVPRDEWSNRYLALALAKEGHLAAAEKVFREFLKYRPDDFLGHLGLGTVLILDNQTNEYVLQLNEAIRCDPDNVEALNNLAWELASSPDATIRNGTRAVALAKHACQLTKYKQTVYIGTLAAAYAAADKFSNAIATAQVACAIAKKNGETALLQSNQELLERYNRHQAAWQ